MITDRPLCIAFGYIEAYNFLRCMGVAFFVRIANLRPNKYGTPTSRYTGYIAIFLLNTWIYEGIPNFFPIEKK